MAVAAFYNHFRRNLGRGAINLSGGNFRMTLHTSASNAATATLSTYGSVTGQVAAGNGYLTSGQSTHQDVDIRRKRGAMAFQLFARTVGCLWRRNLQRQVCGNLDFRRVGACQEASEIYPAFD